jgi:hypothetical protein
VLTSLEKIPIFSYCPILFGLCFFVRAFNIFVIFTVVMRPDFANLALSMIPTLSRRVASEYISETAGDVCAVYIINWQNKSDHLKVWLLQSVLVHFCDFSATLS